MERRAFMKSGALALVTMGLSPSFLRRTAFGMDLFNAPKGKVLICLFQRGAADGLNIIVPHGERDHPNAAGQRRHEHCETEPQHRLLIPTAARLRGWFLHRG